MLMTPSSLPREVRRLINLSPFALPLCVLALIVSVWNGPRAPGYLIVMVVAGLIATAFWLLYWKYRQEHAGAIFFLLLSLGTVSVGSLVALRLTFGYVQERNNLWLAIQYGTIILIIFFTTLRLFGKRIEQMIQPS
jgi:hypothetical protein